MLKIKEEWQQKTLAHPWNIEPTKCPPPVIRITHKSFLFILIKDDPASCSSSDLRATEKKLLKVLLIQREKHYLHTWADLPCRMQRCTDRYCPARFWKMILVEHRPIITLLSGEVSLSAALMSSLSAPSSLSDSDPEILDTSPAKVEYQPTVLTCC